MGIWGYAMKTTIEINDVLLDAAKSIHETIIKP